MFSILKKIHKWNLKWLGLLGLPFYVAATTAAVAVKASAPAAGIGAIATGFYSGLAERAITNLIPGTGIILSEAFRLVTDTIAPGVGSVLTTAFQAVAIAPEAVNMGGLAADILAAPVYTMA